MSKLSIAVVGLGNRAGKYLSCLGGGAEPVCLVEPDALRLRRAADKYSVPPERCFSNARDFFASGIKVDGVIVAGPDRMHFPVAMESVLHGFGVLVEKPAVTSWEEYTALMEESHRHNAPVGVCLIMRYHPYFLRIRELVESGIIGKVVSIRHTEHIGPDRMGHTFVRGGWSRKDVSGPIFLSKCCHDVDFILSLCGWSPAAFVTSEGHIEKFREEMAPEGSEDMCYYCPVENCPYSAVDLYRNRREWIAGFDVPPGGNLDDVIEDVLVSSPYGRCVYRCDNDVFDTQIVETVLENGTRISINLEGTSTQEGREMLICGTEGELRAKGGIIRCGDIYEDYSELENAPLHAGADRLLVEDFLECLRSGKPMKASLESAAQAHRICFLAR